MYGSWYENYIIPFISLIHMSCLSSHWLYQVRNDKTMTGKYTQCHKIEKHITLPYLTGV